MIDDDIVGFLIICQKMYVVGKVVTWSRNQSLIPNLSLVTLVPACNVDLSEGFG